MEAEPAPNMEALYSKLFDKYNKIKTKKLTELDELTKDQEAKFVNYVSAAEELIEHLKSENERLQSQLNDLRSEVASIRHATLISTGFPRMNSVLSIRNSGWKRARRVRNSDKVFSEEVERLQKLQSESTFSSKKDRNNRQPSTRGGTQFESSSKIVIRSSKRKRCSATEMGGVTPHGSFQDDVMQRESTKDLHMQSLSTGDLVNVQRTYLPECCRRTIDRSGGEINVDNPANCLFQALVEFLVGMKFSVSQSEGVCISAEHQSSGYSFSLTWIDKADGKEVELRYHVLSLGTFERVAPQWMKEVIMFSTSMCPIFFERVTRVVKLFS
ncbi:titan [Parasponia andersonii]|uniref:Titan n=1 Tax=Parasponia andersonii TaxID=3476 RepID=A0A2P5B070_PARAD|nr:titan [Parasponia andersonii]